MIASGAATGRGRLWERWLDAVRADADRWPLWLPPAMGVGIAVYFALADGPRPGPGR